MASAQIRVYVDDARVWFSDADPHMSQNRVFVPLRGVFEKMGATVMWNGSTQMVTARRNNTDVQLTIGSRTAYVDGQPMSMDVAPHMMNGRTMVPLRFISETLGADVRWDAGVDAVYITSAGTSTSTGSSGGNAAMLTLPENTVIPVMLDRQLSSNMSREGDRFTATLDTNGSTDYLGLPKGTKLHGIVTKATPRSGQDPGVLALDFQRIELADGRGSNIDGALTGLDDKYVTNEDGRLVAKTAHRNDTLTYVGIGAGAGVLIAILTDSDDWLRNGLIGAGLGWLYNEITRNNNQPRDVTLTEGTEVGVRLDSRLVLR
jgi:hypothetical protein